MKCVVVIPVYKSSPNVYEKKSFEQALKVLGKHSIVLVTFKEFEMNYYINVANDLNVNLGIEFFNKYYFESLIGYNTLCLSFSFYERFVNFDYMLIYQLDAFVFKDELSYWCSKNYDYIGAPWFENNSSYENNFILWKVGNGGFSLRKIKTFMTLHNSNKRIYSLKYLYKQVKNKNKSVYWLIKSYFFRFENNFKFLLKSWHEAEDLFYCIKLADTKLKLNIPNCYEAIPFSFEQSPQYLFKLNNSKLPFGCHAWVKYQYFIFWNKYI